jgi:Ig-like domain from next to BRCA1 gene
MHKTSALLAAIMIIAAIMACNLPDLTGGQSSPADIMTAAALTVQAELTAAAPTSTFTPVAALPVPTSLAPLPTSTAIPTLPPAATPTSNCDSAAFVTDVSFPDNTLVGGGVTFDKIWRLKNVGSCSWTPSYSVVFLSGEQMGGPAVQALTGNVNPDQTIDISVVMTAPSTNGIHTGYWILRNASGVTFHSQFYVQIKVGGGGSGPFAVTHINYTLSTWNDSGHTNCPRVIAHITTNAAGTVTYHWTRSDSSSASTETLIFGSAGTQSINYDWALGHVWNGTTDWVGLYVDSPNHQDFGHLSFTTACTSP